MPRVCVAWFLSAAALLAQDTLNNETILRLWKSGMGEAFIVDQIQKTPGNYSLTSSDLRTLTEAQVPDRVIGAMFLKRDPANAPVRVTPVATAAAPAGMLKTSGLPPVSPSGLPPAAPGSHAVYFKKGASWALIEPETMSWKSSGTTKKVTSAISKYPTMGMMGKPVKATLFGEHSRNDFTGVSEIVVAVPAGTNMQNLLMVAMKPGKGFRTVEVGGSATHASHTSLSFSAEKIQTVDQYDQYKIAMPEGFAPGEYGVYNVSTVFNQSSTAGVDRTAKIFTFSIN